MFKDIKKPLIITICLTILQTVFFTGGKIFQGKPHLIGSTLDSEIPFVNWFIIFYVSWYVLLILLPILFYKKDKKKFIDFSLAYIITITISNIIFIAYPTTVIRPEITDSGIINGITKLIFTLDTPILNCFPSLHCAVCYLFIYHTLVEKKFSKLFKVIICTISLLIVASTMLIKQHVLIDAFGALIVVALSIFIVYKFPLINRSFEKKLKL